jgi:hypothetical protein
VAIANNLKDLSVEIIEEYLTAAKACIDTRKTEGGILGYPATLLLLCATDAIGHGLLPPDNQRNTRLDVLQQGPFSLGLSDTQITNLAHWYRHLLAHTGTMAPGAFLTPETQGKPFEFDMNGALTMIRVPVLYDAVKAAWDGRNKSAFNPPSLRKLPPDPSAKPLDFASNLTPIVSGIWKP